MGSRRCNFFQACAAAIALGAWAGATEARIDIEITGVEGEIRENVLVFLSLQRYREKDDLAPDLVQRLNERVEREVRQALKPFGYYFPQVRSTLRRANANARGGQKDVATAPNHWQVSIHVEPGRAVVVREVDVNIVGPGAEDANLRGVIATAQLRQGERLVHGHYDRLKGELQRIAVSTGYLEANFTRSELRVNLERFSAEAHVELATGPRYRFGPTLIEQDAIEASLARRFLRYEEGEYFDAGALLRTQFALEDSQYFSNVEVITGTRDHTSLTVPVTITAQAYRKTTYSVGLGYATDTRWRGTVGWDNRRVNTRGHRAHARITAADTEQSVNTRYLIPVGDPALEKLSFDANFGYEKLADIDVRKVELRPGLTQLRGRWQRVLFISGSHETTETGLQRASDLLLIPGVSYARVPRGFSGDLLAVRPTFVAELTGSHGFFGSDADYLRLRVQKEHVFDLSPRWHLLLRGEVGVSFVADFSELPGSQRFFAGGDNSVRGFSLNELSPTEPARDRSGNPILDADGQPIFIKTGGRHLLVGSVEVVRDLPRNFGVAVFFDAGNAVNKLGDPLEYSAGVGLRWRLPVVTVGIDVAQALSRSDLGPHFHLNISPKL